MNYPSYQYVFKLGLSSALLLLSLVVGGLTVQAKSGSVNWSLREYPENKDYVEVLIDPRALLPLFVVENIRFEVYFYDNQNTLSKTVLRFTKDGETLVDTRHAYRRYGYLGAHNTSKPVWGGYIYYTLRVAGLLHSDSLGLNCASCAPDEFSSQVAAWEQLEIAAKDIPNYINVVRDAEGKLTPAKGYTWVNPDDPEDFRVMPITGR